MLDEKYMCGAFGQTAYSAQRERERERDHPRLQASNRDAFEATIYTPVVEMLARKEKSHCSYNRATLHVKANVPHNLMGITNAHSNTAAKRPKRSDQKI